MIEEKYKGYELKASREEAMGGWENLYYSVYRESDGLEVICNFSDGEDSEEYYIQWFKEMIDSGEILEMIEEEERLSYGDGF